VRPITCSCDLREERALVQPSPYRHSSARGVEPWPSMLKGSNPPVGARLPLHGDPR
jgi:hypothetical protein